MIVEALHIFANLLTVISIVILYLVIKSVVKKPQTPKPPLEPPDIDNNFFIRIAVQENRLDVVDTLLKDERVNPAALDNQAIRMAVRREYVEMIQLLLTDARVDPHDDTNTVNGLSAYQEALNLNAKHSVDRAKILRIIEDWTKKRDEEIEKRITKRNK